MAVPSKAEGLTFRVELLWHIKIQKNNERIKKDIMKIIEKS